MRIDGKKMFGKPVEKVVRTVLGTVGSVAEVHFERRRSRLCPSAVHTFEKGPNYI